MPAVVLSGYCGVFFLSAFYLILFWGGCVESITVVAKRTAFKVSQRKAITIVCSVGFTILLENCDVKRNLQTQKLQFMIMSFLQIG